MKKRKHDILKNHRSPSAVTPAPKIRIDTDWGLGLSDNKHTIPTVDEVRKLYAPPKTLGASEEVRAAMDEQLAVEGTYSLLQHSIELGTYNGGIGSFLGYGALQNIAQNGLIRACIETVADDMTRKWIEIKATDSTRDDDDDKLDRIQDEFSRLNVREVMHSVSEMAGYYGGCLVYIETRAMAPNLLDPLSPSLYSVEAKDGAHWLKAIRAIDPVNCFPGTYNSTNPLASDFYVPQTWWILGNQVHSSRMIRIVANEPPVLLRPAYNFFGIPQAQILWDYVSHFQANRAAANRLFDKFSTLVFKTELASTVFDNDALQNLDARMLMLAKFRSNDGVIAIDKDSEDIVKIETPLSGVIDIPRQSLEFVAALNRTPVVKLLGISPGGFNATGESDIRNYYDHIKSQQEAILRKPIQRVLELVQLSLFGEIDRAITFDFCELSEEDESKKASTQQIKIGNICQLLDRDVITAEEARQALIADPDSGFNDLDPDYAPEQDAEMAEMGMMEQPVDAESDLQPVAVP